MVTEENDSLERGTREFFCGDEIVPMSCTGLHISASYHMQIIL